MTLSNFSTRRYRKARRLRGPPINTATAVLRKTCNIPHTSPAPSSPRRSAPFCLWTRKWENCSCPSFPRTLDQVKQSKGRTQDMYLSICLQLPDRQLVSSEVWPALAAQQPREEALTLTSLWDETEGRSCLVAEKQKVWAHVPHGFNPPSVLEQPTKGTPKSVLL